MDDKAPGGPRQNSPQDKTLEKYVQRSFAFGLVSLVSFLWLSPVALGFGIASLVQTNKARKRSVELHETPPRKFIPQFILGLIGTISAAVVFTTLMVTIVIGLSGLGEAIGNTINNSSKYSASVGALDAAQKDFTADEIVAFGPFDLTIRDIQSPYTPGTEEATALQPRLDDEAAVYTKFTIDIAYNASRGATYNTLSMDVRSWGDALYGPVLDGTQCTAESGARDELEKYNATYKEGYTEPTTVTYVCISAPDSPKKLTLDISLFSKVSPIVGTEGMPRKNVTYSVQL